MDEMESVVIEPSLLRHCCRFCEKTLERVVPDYSTVCAAVTEIECAAVELRLHDSYNAFCFECNRISLSVPVAAGPQEQLRYLRFQLDTLKKLYSYGLIVEDDEGEG
jgi:hypothetical protein